MGKISDLTQKIERSWISESIRNVPSQLRIARLMLMFLGTSAISCVVLIYVSAITSDSPAWIDFALLIGHLIVCSSAFLVRFTDTMKWPTRVFAVLGACQLVVATAITGGPESNVLFALPVLPIVLSAIVDSRANIVACLVVLLGVSGIFFYHANITPFPTLKNGNLETLLIHIWVLSMALLVGIYSQFQANRLLKVAEKELEQRKAAQDKLAQVNESKDRFLAYMSHEIRNPLTAIVGASELLSMEKMESEHPRYLKSLKNSANSLREIVDAVLDFSQIDSGRMTFDLSPLSPRPFVSDLISQFSATAEPSGVHLNYEIAPGVPTAVIADQTHLRQVLSNLLSNAIKFSNPGDEVWLRVRPHSGKSEGALFLVEDAGLGIRLEDQTKIFEPYQRSIEGSARQGTGLGLPIAQVLLKKMGTTLKLDSELNKGSCFYFVLDAAPALPKATEFPTKPNQTTLQGISVLVAEDNAQAAVVVLGMLRAMGCQAWHARDGQEAINLYQEHQPDCVLMDIQMPVINGVDATQAIRDIEHSSEGKKTFILAVTGEYHQEALTEAEGFNGLLQKPFSPPDLLKVILSGV